MAAPSSFRDGASVVAHSALLSLTASPSNDALALRVTRLSDHQLIVGAGKVTATLDGRAVPLAAEPNGAYLLSLGGQGGGVHTLGVVVSHDGIQELLTGTVNLPRHPSLFDSLQGHGMAAWWVLNVAVVLIAALVISRRRR